MGWKWHKVDHMQIICTSIQTGNHISTSSLNPLKVKCSSWCPNNSIFIWKTTVKTARPIKVVLRKRKSVLYRLEEWVYAGCSSLFLRPWTYRWTGLTTKACHAWLQLLILLLWRHDVTPAATFPVIRILLFDYRGTRMQTTCLRLLPDSRMAGNWLNLWAHSHESNALTIVPPGHRFHQAILCPTHIQQQNNNNNTRLMVLCPGLPRWASTRKVKPISDSEWQWHQMGHKQWSQHIPPKIQDILQDIWRKNTGHFTGLQKPISLHLLGIIVSQQYSTGCSKKWTPWFILTITSVNMDRF